jgi:hypothetical protein
MTEVADTEVNNNPDKKPNRTERLAEEQQRIDERFAKVVFDAVKGLPEDDTHRPLRDFLITLYAEKGIEGVYDHLLTVWNYAQIAPNTPELSIETPSKEPNADYWAAQARKAERNQKQDIRGAIKSLKRHVPELLDHQGDAPEISRRTAMTQLAIAATLGFSAAGLVTGIRKEAPTVFGKKPASLEVIASDLTEGQMKDFVRHLRSHLTEENLPYAFAALAALSGYAVNRTYTSLPEIRVNQVEKGLKVLLQTYSEAFAEMHNDSQEWTRSVKERASDSVTLRSKS